ncbi:MAG: EAL domain-containing protein [Actinobacteria bacterium]|nr:MAG: EAL domain-containing protein [Actinomycetota bacterium]
MLGVEGREAPHRASQFDAAREGTSEAGLAGLFGDVYVLCDRDGRVLWASPGTGALLGYNPECLAEVAGPGLAHPGDRGTALAWFKELRDRRGGTLHHRLRARHAGGSWRLLDVVGKNLLDDTEVGAIVFRMRDVTEEREIAGASGSHDEQLVALLEHQATHDPLTGLPNRTLLLDRLGIALARAARRDTSVALLFLDLDNLKIVNDSLGHTHGDHLLACVARRLKQAVRPEDTIARFGGDEFVLLCEGIIDEHQAIAIAERVSDAVSGSYSVADAELFVTVSIGIALADGKTAAEVLIRDADAAMYEAKSRGRARLEMFDAEMRARAVERFEVENGLRKALESGQLRLRYQPIFDLESSRLVGVEALLRWEHPDWGLVGPAEFLRIAEETGLVVPIGSWAPDLFVSVNVSGRQLNSPAFIDATAEAIGVAGVPPAQLALEVSENVLMDDIDGVADALGRLSGLGALVAVDDFGTGFSSLSHLRCFPVDLLKIDQSFVAGVDRDPEDAAVVAAVVALAQNLGIKTIAEGVETAGQAAELRRLRCDLAQGFHLGEERTAEAIEDLLRR